MGSNLNYYFNANVANDDGWADHNSRRLRQAFGKLRYTDANTTLSLSAGGADNDLLGSQTIPRSFLGNPRQAYTFPDQNQNNVGYVTLSCDHYFNDHVELSGNVYYRHSRNSNVSSNNNTDFGSINPDGSVDTVEGTNEQSVVSTDSYGASFQLTLLGRPAGMDNQFIAGVAADLANSQYTAASQCASVTDSRATIGIGNYVQQTDAKTRSANYGIYFHDVLSLTRQWSFTLAGRHNWASAQIGDESSMQPLLDGRHVFPRFNPSVGINWTPPPASRPTRHTTRVCARRRPSNWLARTPPHPARYRTTFWRTRR